MSSYNHYAKLFLNTLVYIKTFILMQTHLKASPLLSLISNVYLLNHTHVQIKIPLRLKKNTYL